MRFILNILVSTVFLGGMICGIMLWAAGDPSQVKEWVRPWAFEFALGFNILVFVTIMLLTNWAYDALQQDSSINKD